jgi:hypothetical protein
MEHFALDIRVHRGEGSHALASSDSSRYSGLNQSPGQAHSVEYIFTSNLNPNVFVYSYAHHQ